MADAEIPHLAQPLDARINTAHQAIATRGNFVPTCGFAVQPGADVIIKRSFGIRAGGGVGFGAIGMEGEADRGRGLRCPRFSPATLVICHHFA